MVLDDIEKGYIIASIENLAIIKMFHDKGVDVSNFPEYYVDSRGMSDEGAYIFELGMSKLFSKCEHLYQDDEEKIFKQLVQMKLLQCEPEHVFLISIPRYKENSETIWEEVKHYNNQLRGDHGKIIIDPNKQEMYLIVEFLGNLLEETSKLLSIWDKLKK